MILKCIEQIHIDPSTKAPLSFMPLKDHRSHSAVCSPYCKHRTKIHQWHVYVALEIYLNDPNLLKKVCHWFNSVFISQALHEDGVIIRVILVLHCRDNNRKRCKEGNKRLTLNMTLDVRFWLYVAQFLTYNNWLALKRSEANWFLTLTLKQH